MIPSSHVNELHAAEHAVAADRFAHEIVRFLVAYAARSRQLNDNPLGHTASVHQALKMLLRFEMIARFASLVAAGVFLVACSTSSSSAGSISVSPVVGTVDPFMGVPERVITTPFPTVALPEQPAPNFAFSIGYGACSITRVVDTFKNTLSQHSDDGSSTTISFKLTADERVTVYQTMKTINLFGYPDIYTIPVPDNTLRIIPEPHPRYELVLRNGRLNKTITWEDAISRPTAVEAVQLRGFIENIRALVAKHSETAQLPTLNEGCA